MKIWDEFLKKDRKQSKNFLTSILTIFVAILTAFVGTGHGLNAEIISIELLAENWNFVLPLLANAGVIVYKLNWRSPAIAWEQLKKSINVKFHILVAIISGLGLVGIIPASTVALITGTLQQLNITEHIVKDIK